MENPNKKIFDKMEEEVVLVLNNEGEDIQVSADIHTANILLNDTHAAANLVRQLKNSGIVPSNSNIATVSNAAGTSKQIANESNSSPTVWRSKTPNQNDVSATEYFLSLREKYASKFDDRKTIKSQIWKQIANEMKDAGYNLGEEGDVVEKLRLKFSGLQKQYYLYIKHINSTGEKHKEKPLHFDILHSILGSKHITNPEKLEDSFNQPESAEDKDVQNRFLTERDKKPKNATAQVVELLEKQNKDRSEQFSVLQNILREQNRQREDLLQEFKKLVELEQKRTKQ